MKNYYALLGVDRKATTVEIKKNYRKLAVKYHPDKSSDPEAPAKFIRITEAYDVLSNKKRRAAYDLYIWESLRRQKESQEAFATVVPPRESTRTRRNKAQKKRSIAYHSSTSGQLQKALLLAKESIYVISRYYLYILGATLLLVMLRSLVTEIVSAFKNGVVSGIMVGVFLVATVYGIIKLLQLFFIDFNKDIESMSVFYKMTLRNAGFLIGGVLAIVLASYTILLMVTF